jgi:hypothetical protein
MLKRDITKVSKETGVSKDVVIEYLEMDFEEGEPEVDELIGHIEYQENLVRMLRSCDDERAFDEAWCSAYVY